MFFINVINPANDQKARMISLWGGFYVCSTCTMVMVHNWTTKDSHEGFCHKSSIFKKGIVAFSNRQGWQNELMNVLLVEQDWCKELLPPVVTSLPRLRMPEMPTPGWCMVRAAGMSRNCHSSNFFQATLTQPERSLLQLQLVLPRWKTGQQLQLLNLLLIQIQCPKIQIIRMASQQP